MSDPQIAPSGSAYRRLDDNYSLNNRSSMTYKVAASGGAPPMITENRRARWSPDGKRVAYIAGDQLWVADQMGGARKQLTTLAGGATGPVWSPSGDRIAFTSRVFPACTDDACNVSRQKAVDSNPVKAHVADELMYRHWNAWDDGTRAHLFVGPWTERLLDLISAWCALRCAGRSVAEARATRGRPTARSSRTRRRTRGARTRGARTTISTRLHPRAENPRSSPANKGADENPVYSPDGKLILYHSQARAGFESDRWRLMAYDRSSHQSRELLPAWDRNADSYSFIADGHTLLIQTVDASREKFIIAREAATPGAPQLVLSSATTHRRRSITRDARSRGCRTPPTAPPKCSSPRSAPACRG